jgi:hypothetical protein
VRRPARPVLVNAEVGPTARSGWRVLNNIRSTVATTGCDEGGREIAAEQRDIGRVRPVGHAERAAGSITGIARSLHLRRNPSELAEYPRNESSPGLGDVLDYSRCGPPVRHELSPSSSRGVMSAYGTTLPKLTPGLCPQPAKADNLNQSPHGLQTRGLRSNSARAPQCGRCVECGNECLQCPAGASLAGATVLRWRQIARKAARGGAP